MKIETFQLERTQSLWEHTVEFNLTETGIHPFELSELLSGEELDRLLHTRLGYGHTNGSPELRRAIAALYPDAEMEHVLVTNGSAEANFLAMWSLVEPGDEVVLMLPNYMQIWGLVRAFGARVRPFHLLEERQWHFDPEALRAAVTPRTKVIAVCNPNNPTGAVLTRAEMAELMRLAEEAGAWLYADEVYRGAELAGEETPTLWGSYERTAVCGGLSKAYALPGLRIGWLVGPKDFIERAWSYHDYTTIAPGVLSDRVASRVLQPEVRAKFLERNRAILRENLGFLEKWVARPNSGFHFVPPRAGGLAFLRYDFPVNSTRLCTQLRERNSVFLIPGDCFGLDGYVRVGIGAEPSYFAEGLERVAEFCSGVAPPQDTKK